MGILLMNAYTYIYILHHASKTELCHIYVVFTTLIRPFQKIILIQNARIVKHD